MNNEKYFFNKVKKQTFFTSGLRLWSNGIPLRFDTYSQCNNRCIYCYASQVQSGAVQRMGFKYDPRLLKLGNIAIIQKACNKAFDETDKYNPHSFQEYWIRRRGLIECGTMGDPFMSEEPRFMNTYNLMQLAKHYRLPLYFNTKGNCLITDNTHFDALCDLKKSGVIVDLSLTSINDKLLKQFEPYAPLASERFKLLERLTDNNIDTIVSARPIIAGVTDVAYKEYIEACCLAGATSIHLRTLILSGMQLKSEFWKNYAKINNMDFKHISYRYNIDYFNNLVNEAMDIAKTYGTSVTASHVLFFKFGTANKCDYSKVSPMVANATFSPRLEHILKPCMDNINTPKLLLFDNIMKPLIKQHPDFMSQHFKIDSQTSTLIWSSSCVYKVRIPYLQSGESIFTNSVWNGWYSGEDRNTKLRTGYISSVNGIYQIVDKIGNPVLDDSGNMQYAYIPDEYKSSNITSTHIRPTQTVTEKELKYIGIY